MALTVCLSAFYVCLKHVGSGGVYRRFLRTKTCVQTTRVGCTTRTSYWTDASRLSQGKRTVCRPDPTSEYVCFFTAEVFIVNLRADLRKYNKSSAIAKARAMRRVS